MVYLSAAAVISPQFMIADDQGHHDRWNSLTYAMRETAYLFQAVLIIAWWLGIAFNQSFYEVFQIPGLDRQMFFAFLIPDIAIIAVFSIIRTYKISRDVQLIILGAFLYATLFCLNAAMIGQGGYLPTIVMTFGLLYNVFLCYDRQMFRVSTSSSIFANAFKTLVQVVCVWFFTLMLMPLLIQRAFGRPIIPTLGPQVWIGGGVFALFSCLGLSSAYFFVMRGKGTPLPLDQTNVLVTTGPYRYVRNPMAIAGIGQGVAVGIIYQSIPILVYCALGGLVWQVVIRPIEEGDLLERFGDSYRDYRSNVACWIPRWRRNAE